MKTALPNFIKTWKSLLTIYYWRRTSLLMLFMSSIVSLTTAQTKLWDKTLGGVKYYYTDPEKGLYLSGDALLRAQVATPGGGYLLAGVSDSRKGGDKSENTEDGRFVRGNLVRNYDIWVVQIDRTGHKVWDKTFSTGIQPDELTAAIATPDGGYLLGGSSNSDKAGDKSENSKGGTDYWLLKIDRDGNKLWDKTLGGSKEDFLTVIISTSDGGYLLGGSSNSDIGADKSEINRGSLGSDELDGYSFDYWIIKIDATGNKLWDKTYGGTKGDNLSALSATSDGGYILGGTAISGIGGDKSEASRDTGPYIDFYQDYWVVKIDGKGTKLWDKTIGGTSTDTFSALAIMPDGGYLLGGTSYSPPGKDKSKPDKEVPQGFWENNHYWVAKISATGSKVWDKTFGGSQFYDYLTSIITTPDGNFLLGGYSSSNAGLDKSEDAHQELGEINDDYWLIKINNNGTKIWDKTIGSAHADVLTSLIPTTNNSYLLGGYSQSGLYNFGDISGDKTENGKGFTDYWVVKLKDEIPPLLSAWDQRYGGRSTDNFTAAIKTADGGYLSGGYSKSYNGGDKNQNNWGENDYWIVKSDKNGHKLWDKSYGGTQDDFLNRVIQTQDGGYLLGGSSLSGLNGNKTQANRGDRDYWVVKVDAMGNKQWDQSFGGSGYDELKKVIQLSTGEYVLGGYSNSLAGGDKTQNSQGGTDYWLVKISATGKKIWDKRFGGSFNETLGSFTETQDGGFLLGGSSFSGKSGDKNQANRGGSDFWVVRTDKAGNQLWDKTYGGSGPDEAYSVGRSGPDFFIAGTSQSGQSGDKSQDSQGSNDYWVVKVNAKGNKLWDKRFGGDKGDELRASTSTPDGGIVLGGTSFSGISGDKSQTSRGSSDYWVVKVDKDGQKVYDRRYGGNGTEELRTVFQTNDGGLLLGGRSDSPVSGEHSQAGRGYRDYWLVKVAPDTASLVAAREAALTEEPVTQVEEWKVQAYPNPFFERVTIRFSLLQTQTATVKVYDSQGREITTLFQDEAKANQTYQVEWRADKKAAGMYLLHLQTPTNHYHQKLLLTK